MLKPILQLKGVLKDFPGVRALNRIDLDLYPSEVHGLVGENGAGKSTLLKILSGALQKDQGELRLDDKPVSIPDPKASQELGISVIYQEFNLVPQLSIARNIFLGHESHAGSRFILNNKKLNQKAADLLADLGINLDTRRLVADLSVAEKQMVEIARALSLESKIVLMDEPSGPLSEHEISFLFKIIQALKKRGVAIVYVSHRLEEIFQITDRVSVLRDGFLITTKRTEDIDLQQVIHLMVGREIKDYFPKETYDRGDMVLEIKGLNGERAADLCVHAGEVVGIAGLVGSGRTELAHIIFGLNFSPKVKILFNGQEIRPRSPWEAIRLGIGMVPEDRKEQGLITALSVRDNITLPIIDELRRWMRIDRRKQKGIAEHQVSQLKIQTPSIHQITQNLSGGNQQKVVLAKWLAKRCNLLIMDEPTRGIDVGAKTEMYKLMSMLVSEGKAILFISSDLPEVIAMSDRIYAMRDGCLAAELPGQTTSQETIIRHITQGERHVRY